MRFGLLGPLEVMDEEGAPVDVGGHQPRTLLAVLLVAAGRAVSVDAIVDAIWGDEPPASATGTLQSYVSRLRRRLGRHANLVGELAELVHAHPLREGLRRHLALALYRAGRQAEALRALADARRVLRDELGIEPSRPLRELESAILDQDPALDLTGSTGADATIPRDAGPGDAAPSAPDDGGGDSGETDDSSEAADSGKPADAGAPGESLTTAAAPFVGRDAELAQLVAALDEARADARFVVVEGEPGIGKTRLADELRRVASARDAVAVWGRSDESGAAPALWPWLAPLRALAGHIDDVAPALRELLAGEAPLVPGRAVDIQFERFEAVAELLTGAGATAPVVVLLDDLQWADAASLELLAFLAGRVERGVLVVATMRHLEVGRSDAVTDALAAIARRHGSRRIQLRGLSASATNELLGAMSASAPHDDVAATIHARSEGNPFYAIELARLIDEEGNPGAAVPASVRDVVRRRLSRLPTATVDLLGIAAVTGRDVELGLLVRAASASGETTLDDLEPAIVHRLLVEVPAKPSVFRFSHALVREVLLDDMSALRRARLHLKVADAMEAGGAGIDDDLVAELDALIQLLEVARARRYFQGAVNSEVVNRAKYLAQRCHRHDLYLDLLWFEWSAYATSCRGKEAEPLARAYVELTGSDPRPEVQAYGHEVWAVLCWGAGRITEAVEHLDIALQLIADAPMRPANFDIEKRMICHTFWLWMHAAHGDRSPQDLFRRYDQLIADFPDRFVVASICGFAATTAIAIGDWAQLERYVEIGREADPGAQFSFWGGQNLMQGAIVLARRGDLDAALQSFAEGKARYSGIGGRSALATFESTLGLVLAEQGRPETAKELVANARAELDTYQERWNEPVVLIAEGVLAAVLGDATAAAERLALAAEVADAQGSHGIARRARAVAADSA